MGPFQKRQYEATIHSDFHMDFLPANKELLINEKV
jgi:hypothetical protein